MECQDGTVLAYTEGVCSHCGLHSSHCGIAYLFAYSLQEPGSDLYLPIEGAILGGGFPLPHGELSLD